MREDKKMTPFIDAVTDPMREARAAKAGGAKIVGYVGNGIPREIMEEAGLFPLRLRGTPGRDTPLADRYMEDLFDPAVRAIFEDILAGRYDELEAIVLPRTDDSAQRLYYYLCELRRSKMAKVASEPVLLDVLHTPWYSSAHYNEASFESFVAWCVEQGGRTVDAGVLSDCVMRILHRRNKLCELTTRRRQGGVSPSSYLSVLAASQVMSSRRFDAALNALLEALGDVVGEGTRIVVAGSAIDDMRWYDLLAACGAHVVGDYHANGELMIGSEIPHRSTPATSLLDYYHRGFATTRRFPSDPEDIVRFCRDAEACGVIFVYYRQEEALTWDYPAQARKLAQVGIESLCLNEMPYALPLDAIETRIKPFLSSLEAAR